MDQSIKNFAVKIHPSKKYFDNMKFLLREIFVETAKARFSALDSDYIRKKFNEERFPTEGNFLLSKYFLKYLKLNLNRLKNKKSLTLLDIGSAGGSLTTIFAINALKKAGLLNKTKILLVDVAKDALTTTLAGNFELPKKFIKFYKLGGFGTNGQKFKDILKKQATYFTGSPWDLPKTIKPVDFCLSGFTHHHMNIYDKQKACRAMERITALDGFIGITDESLSYKDYLNWLQNHENEINSRGEPVPIAQECFISIAKHIKFFKHFEIDSKHIEREYYCFAGIKTE